MSAVPASQVQYFESQVAGSWTVTTIVEVSVSPTPLVTVRVTRYSPTSWNTNSTSSPYSVTGVPWCVRFHVKLDMPVSGSSDLEPLMSTAAPMYTVLLYPAWDIGGVESVMTVTVIVSVSQLPSWSVTFRVTLNSPT